ncbi:MAG: NUDIX domain-containing protein [Chitinophagaceae bacterium]|nr:MAG: NUDIX domain-containing protein [Chitinophagaceae bacterium]
MAENIELEKEGIVYSGYLKIKEGSIKHKLPGGKTVEYKREKIDKKDAVCVLLYHKIRKTIILVSQFRYAVNDRIKEPLLEAVAGIVDSHDKTPEQAAIRELKEETGIRLKKENLIFLTEIFPSPGYTSEKIFIYLGLIDEDIEIKKTAGVETENEYIETVEIPVKEFYKSCSDGRVADAKTVIAGLLSVSNAHIII